jgi:hypothetical protein
VGEKKLETIIPLYQSHIGPENGASRSCSRKLNPFHQAKSSYSTRKLQHSQEQHQKPRGFGGSFYGGNKWGNPTLQIRIPTVFSASWLSLGLGDCIGFLGLLQQSPAYWMA